jgi:hypothetical protein
MGGAYAAGEQRTTHPAAHTPGIMSAMTASSPDLRADMIARAEALVATARGHGYELDYRIASLETLDSMLDDLFAVRNPIGRMRGRLAIRRFEPMVPIVGAYVGETLRRECGGDWGVNEEFDEPGLLLPPDRWIFPLAKAEKRFRHGHSDSLSFFAEVMSDIWTGQIPGTPTS